MEQLLQQIEEAMWAGDVDKLDELAHCVCCCWEHTFEGCPARMWHGCRGSGNTPYADEQAWLRHYQTHHGMTEAQFYGEEEAAA